MEGLHYIRVHVFRISQAELAQIAGCTQSQISRCERGERSLSLDELRRIRAEAIKRGHRWRDSWFFDEAIPAEAAATSQNRRAV